MSHDPPKTLLSTLANGVVVVMEKNQLKPVDVVRDKYGYWTHPEFTKYWNQFIGEGAEYYTAEQREALERVLNIETFRTSLELEDYEAWKKYVESCDASDWQPEKPIIDGDWFLVSIFCNEDGAFATWAKEKFTTNRVYSYTGEECWSDYESPRSALKDMFDYGDLEIGNTFLTGIKSVPGPTRYLINADEILEKYDESIDCEHGCDYTDCNTGSGEVTDDAKNELNEFLEKWAHKHLNITFWEIYHEERIKVTQEMIDAFHANEPIPMPELKFKEQSHDSQNT